MGEHAIEVRSIGKQYRLGASSGDRAYSYKSLRDVLSAVPRRLFGRRRPNEPRTFWALKDVSFDVAEGEVVGLIGRNGAGKSTFLKVLSRVTNPTEGSILLRGRIGSLLEVGTGFHPVIRPALSTDLQVISHIAVSANEYGLHPIASLAFPTHEASLSMFLTRYTFLYSLPQIHFFIAVHSPPPSTPTQNKTAEEEIVGYIAYRQAGNFPEEEFKPDVPEGTDVELLGYFMGKQEEHKVELKSVIEVEGMAEIEVFDVLPSWQRRVVGGLLMGEVVRRLDERREKCYVSSMKAGKGVYERFGFKTLVEEGWGVELERWGRGMYISWDLVREVGGKVGGGEG